MHEIEVKIKERIPQNPRHIFQVKYWFVSFELPDPVHFICACANIVLKGRHILELYIKI